VNFHAEVTDNIGISTVRLDYKINGILQEPVLMETSGSDFFAANIHLTTLGKNDRLEYRITATDNSSRLNKRMYPAIGFQEVMVYSPYNAVKSYSSNFETGAQDFSFADFTVSTLNGLKSNILHTVNPYPGSAFDNEKYNMIAQLKYPIIIQENGQLSFDEIVLVEPGQNGHDIWDYVIVEASIDGGKNWLPLTEKYNSVVDDNWYSAFKKNFSGNTSTAMPHESMFVNHTINLTQNTGLAAGDTAIFRFRLASDNSVNGFGWAIDNLEIQGKQEEKEEILAEGRFQLYP
jgi:hypothetical protein